MYSKADHDRIHDAIVAAEQRTSGEIFCVVAEESGHMAAFGAGPRLSLVR